MSDHSMRFIDDGVACVRRTCRVRVRWSRLAAGLFLIVAGVVPPGAAFTAELPRDTNQIVELSPDDARRLAAECDGVICLMNGREDEKTVGGFSVLPLNGLKSLSAETAEALASYKGDGLMLSGLTELSEATARALARFKGQLLVLNGLTTLSPEVARGLAQFRGTMLYLRGASTLSAETAREIARFRGPEHVINGAMLFLSGLTVLPPEAAAALAGCSAWDGHLPKVTAFEAADAVEAARSLATRPRKASLSLPNLKRISPKTFLALIEKKDVDIPPLETLEFIAEPDGSLTEDFVIPEGFKERSEGVFR